MTSPQPPFILASRMIEGQTVRAALSEGFTDKAWDDFLRSVPVGQFQQSSLWSQAKRSEGWQCLRVTLERDGAVAGGFQMLWKNTRVGRLGYISKGPVLTPGAPDLGPFALDVLHGLMRSHRIAAIIAQPPDHHPLLTDGLQKRGFAPNRVMAVMDATLWADLSGPPGQWEANMRGNRRKYVRKATRMGVTIFEGGEAHVPVFFDLMLSSCRRQGVRPNPPTLEAATQLVQAFARTGESRLAFAVCQGETVAAVLDLRFGQRYTGWKKGWNGRHGEVKPNVLLTHDSMRAARALGCACYDFGGVGRPLAEALLAQQPLTPEQLNHYDRYKLGFGAQPQLLPPAMIYFRNPVARFAYRHIAARPLLAGWLKRFGDRW